MESRSWCGSHANPQGAFLSLIFGADAFLDAPVLEYIRPDVNGRVYAFVAKDTDSLVNKTGLLINIPDLLNLKNLSQNVVNLTQRIGQTYGSLLSNNSIQFLNVLKTSGENMVNQIERLINYHLSMTLDDMKYVFQTISQMWNEAWTKLQNQAETFIDSVQDNARIVKFNVSQLVDDEVETVKENLHNLLNSITGNALKVTKDLNGFGLRFKGALDILGLKLLGLEVEVVYSVDQLGACSRFRRVYSLLQNEKAVRGYAVFSLGVSAGTGHRLCNTLSIIDLGVGMGLAISLENKGKFVVQFHAEAKILGVAAAVDVFLSNSGLHYYTELSVWNTFKAQVDVVSELGRNWEELNFNVQGRFVADADGDGSFDDSYSAALRRFTKHLSDEAEKRLSGVQDDFSKAQNGLTKAQNWLDEKKSIFDSADSKFDDAVNALDVAKDKLEQAKTPFQHAVDKLNEAQHKVDNLCRIKDCKKYVCLD